jgi:hypothetical protein
MDDKMIHRRVAIAWAHKNRSAQDSNKNLLKVLGGAAVVTSGSVCIERVLNQPLHKEV